MSLLHPLRWLLALGYAAAIHIHTATGTLNPSAPLPYETDKIVHACQFGLLAWLLWRPWREKFPNQDGREACVLIFAFAALNAAADELHQAFIPAREAAWGDFAADAAGAGIALACRLFMEKARPRAAAKP